MNLIDFTKEFPSEEACEEYRVREGVVCPKCKSVHHYWKSDKKSFECKQCHYRQSLTANTVMHGSQLPLLYWFTTMHLLTSTKKSFSASELQRQLGHKTYRPIWAMLHKLKIAMGKWDERYTLANMEELDEGFFTTEVPDNEKGKPLKNGRGSQRKTKVLEMAETVEGNPTKKEHKHTAVKHIKMIVIDNLESTTIDTMVKENIESNSSIISDHSTSYTNFKAIVASHRPQVIPKEKVGEILPWAHIAISNAKRLFLDVYHDICPEYIQNYLSEFCWEFNRRYFGDALFDRLVITCLAYNNEFRYRIN